MVRRASRGRFAHAKAKGEAVSCDLPEARWTTFAKGTKWKGKVRVVTGGVGCDALIKQ
jgi:hypothetical protein